MSQTHRGDPIPEHGRRERFRGFRLLFWRSVAAAPGLLIAGLAAWHLVLSSSLGADLDDVAQLGENWVLFSASLVAVGGILSLVFRRGGLGWFTASVTAGGAMIGVVVWLIS